VYLSIAFHPTSVGHAAARLRRLLGIELRRLVVEDLLEVPEHDIGVKVGAVVGTSRPVAA